jgi:dihydrolipoamide dehydrogenase
MTKEKYDLIVIGGGPAGYAGAIRAGQLDKKVACIENEAVGGTCLNWGCIPLKTLIKSAQLYESFQHANTFGITCDHIQVDFQKIMARSRDVAHKMGRGIEFLFKKNNVNYFSGKAHIATPQEVQITEGNDAGKHFYADRILIATGCKPKQLPGLHPDGTHIMTSREALAIKTMPSSIVIIGAGAIGVEFAYFFRTLGTAVTLVETMPQILPNEDNEISQTLTRTFKRQGIQIHTQTTLKDIQVTPNSVKTILTNKEQNNDISLETQMILISIGVTPNTQGLFSQQIKPTENNGYIQVDNNYQTSIKGIYAAGDIIGAPQLAHVATFESIQAINAMFGHSKTAESIGQFPSCTYCQPQTASIGLTQQQAQERKLKFKLGKFPFKASGTAVVADQTEGFIKVITDEQTDELLGAHIIGTEATELIQEYVLAMKNKLTAKEIHRTIHAHPTLTEALAEAVAATTNQAIHI